ncbi:hypothetical protein J6590_096077 [Homalodisca vitripennis]|nr:hypothetical protein J6590_096077 [Homalodisca vitripennis]
MADNCSSDGSDPNFFEDDTDADPDYLPSGNEDNSARDLFRNRPSTSGVVVEEQNNGPPAKRPKHEGKKKTRRPDQWKRKKGSIARNKGEGYTDRTGKNHQPKQVRDFNHNFPGSASVIAVDVASGGNTERLLPYLQDGVVDVLAVDCKDIQADENWPAVLQVS